MVRSPATSATRTRPRSTDYDNGKMDGFDTIVAAEPRRPFYYYAESQIPNYWAYARNFALFDHFFSTLAGPSSPGHFAIVTAQTPHYGNSTATTAPTTAVAAA